MRKLSFEKACAQYVHRFTMDHVPAWALTPVAYTTASDAPDDGPRYHGPQFASDREWYENTKFRGEDEIATSKYCHTTGQTWPLGHWLKAPYSRAQKRGT